jgi:hypothetical protein
MDYGISPAQLVLGNRAGGEKVRKRRTSVQAKGTVRQCWASLHARASCGQTSYGSLAENLFAGSCECRRAGWQNDIT